MTAIVITVHFGCCVGVEPKATETPSISAVALIFLDLMAVLNRRLEKPFQKRAISYITREGTFKNDSGHGW